MGSTDRPVVLAIDGNSLVHRSFHAMADSGQPAWAVRGLLTQLVAAVDRIRPVAVVIGFDDPERSLRRERWPQYKAHRGEKLDTLVEQLDLAVMAMRELGLCVVMPPGLEADDVLASTASWARAQGAETVIVTSDRDAFALIDDSTRVLRIINGGVDASPLMTPDRLHLLCGVRPEQYRDYAALRGDPSDNLPGVHGIGPRTGAKLLAEFGTAAAAFADLDAVRERLGAGLAKRLADPEARPRWELNCRVMTPHADLDLGLSLDGGCGVLPFAASAVAAVFRGQRLVWSIASALRVLADVEPDEERPPRELHVWSTGAAPASGRRLPKLPIKPKVDQLALF
ncbi:MAG: 5'-3' exonuclease [Jatrophihabitans sp.]|uniref:5'-3' exonuclease n=1 Tax=Jatrophihabitans sp. TaxID=1932789 RepID=UPI003F7D027F